jgi:GMP synthase-like glutamine amidotransferase
VLFLDVLDDPVLNFGSDYRATIDPVTPSDVHVEYVPGIQGEELIEINIERYSGIIISGSLTPYCSDKKWVKRLSSHLVHWHSLNAFPVLGICMAHCLIASTFGGSIERTLPKEIGTIQLRKTKAGEESMLLSGLPLEFSMLSAHTRDVIIPPLGAVALAKNERGPCQAMQFGNLYGVQFHAELSAKTMREWLRTEDGYGGLIDQGIIASAAELELFLSERVLECESRENLFRDFFNIMRTFPGRRRC